MEDHLGYMLFLTTMIMEGEGIISNSLYSVIFCGNMNKAMVCETCWKKIIISFKALSMKIWIGPMSPYASYYNGFGRLVALRIYVPLALFQWYHDLEAGDNQSLKFKWRDRESKPSPLAPQAKNLTIRPPPLPIIMAVDFINLTQQSLITAFTEYFYMQYKVLYSLLLPYHFTFTYIMVIIMMLRRRN